jgi:alkylation response protein AidB-like acyl-CoA dehydrogenase
MHLNETREDKAFRAEVRSFFATEYPQDILTKVRGGQVLTKDDQKRSQIALQSRGWFALTWPKEYGGPGFSPRQRYIFDEELEIANAPGVIPMGVIYIGPLICEYGTDWQKKAWLPATLNSEIFWAQGYSEPDSGSDLASLRTKGERDGDDFIINGRKTWTSQAHWADWIFCLVRTSHGARKQDGISVICFPMDTPGVSVQPIIGIDGSHYLNSVTLDNVRVPARNLIGEEGKGWGLAKFILGNERLSYAHISRKREDLKILKARARDVLNGRGSNATLPPDFAAKIAAYEIELDHLEISVFRVLTGSIEGPLATSRLKIEATENAQKLTELFVELSGYDGLPVHDRRREDWADAIREEAHFAQPAVAAYLFTRAQTIYGGTTEVQKDIIARALG